MRYDEWQAGIPDEIKGDSLWKLEVYRLGLFIGDIAWQDALALSKTLLTSDLAKSLSVQSSTILDISCSSHSLISTFYFPLFYILKTPKLCSSTGEFNTTDKANPNTCLVSTGSITPSSHNRAVE